ncbi:MAG: hypothetical protein ACXVPQ_05395 [Bacteroidia bacterium]
MKIARLGISCCYLVFLFSACNHDPLVQEKTTAAAPDVKDSVPADNDSILRTGVMSQRLLKKDPAIAWCFANLDRIEKCIDPSTGLYYIGSSPGVTPVLECLKDQASIDKKDPFTVFSRDVMYIDDSLYVNPAEFDPCNIVHMGYYYFNVPDTLKLLEDAYYLNKLQSSEKPDAEYYKRLQQIDASITKRVVVYFRNKHGEMVTLTFYFSQSGRHTYLTFIDARDCGA